jgi:NitT/TauT family transport system substrate-binding protein
VKVSSQAYTLEYASQALFGASQYDRFDHLTVSLGHPDAVAALLSGSGITAHFATEPYHLIELQNPKIHTVTSDAQIYGRPPTSTAIWTTTRFHDANPRLCQAILAALESADAFIAAHPDEAARIFIKVDGGHFPLPLVEQALAGLSFGTAPQGIVLQADFMRKVGAISTAPARWQDLFFPDVRDRSGS